MITLFSLYIFELKKKTGLKLSLLICKMINIPNIYDRYVIIIIYRPGARGIRRNITRRDYIISTNPPDSPSQKRGVSCSHINTIQCRILSEHWRLKTHSSIHFFTATACSAGTFLVYPEFLATISISELIVFLVVFESTMLLSPGNRAMLSTRLEVVWIAFRPHLSNQPPVFDCRFCEEIHMLPDWAVLNTKFLSLLSLFLNHL